MQPSELKHKLCVYRKIRTEADLLKKRLATKRQEADGLKAVLINDVPKGTELASSVEKAVENIEATMSYYIARINALEDREVETLKLIELIDNSDGRSIIFLHYIEGVKFEDIPGMLYISERAMWRAYNEAVKKLAVNGSK